MILPWHEAFVLLPVASLTLYRARSRGPLSPAALLTLAALYCGARWRLASGVAPRLDVALCAAWPGVVVAFVVGGEGTRERGGPGHGRALRVLAPFLAYALLLARYGHVAAPVWPWPLMLPRLVLGAVALACADTARRGAVVDVALILAAGQVSGVLVGTWAAWATAQSWLSGITWILCAICVAYHGGSGKNVRRGQSET